MSDLIADALSGLAWIETAPCGCVASVVLASRCPTKALALAEFGLTDEDESWPLTVVSVETARAGMGCTHDPQWEATP